MNKEELYAQAVEYVRRISADESEAIRTGAMGVFEARTRNLVDFANPHLHIAGHENSLCSSEVVKAILHNAMVEARHFVRQAREDRRLEETGIIQSERQAFDIAKERLK